MKEKLFLSFAMFLIVSEVISARDIKVDQNVEVEVTNDNLRLNCNNQLSLDNTNDFKKFNENKTIKEVIIDSCSPPSGSYADILRAINVNVPDIKRLIILNPQLKADQDNSTGPDPKRPQSQHLRGFELEELQILNDNTSSVLGIDLEFLKDTSLKKLTLTNVEIWGPFPKSSKVQTVELSNVIFHENIGECSKLKVLHMNNVQLIGEQQKWLMNCLKLIELKLEHLSSETSNKILISLSAVIQNVTVHYCSLKGIPSETNLIKTRDLRLERKSLRHLDLAHNNIEYGPRYSLYKGLETLDLSYNKMKYFDKTFLYSDFVFPNLREVKLDGNNFADICDTDYGITRIRQTKNDDWKYHKELDTPLKRLSLSNTGLSYLCFGNVLVPNMEFFDVTHNNITELDYRTFYWVSNEHLEVDMRHNPLKTVAFTKEDYQSMNRNDPAVTRWSKMTVLTNARLSCDCNLAWFARAIRERLLTVKGATCENGSAIDDPYVFKSC